VEPRRSWAGIGQALQDCFLGGKVGFEVLMRDGGLSSRSRCNALM